MSMSTEKLWNEMEALAIYKWIPWEISASEADYKYLDLCVASSTDL